MAERVQVTRLCDLPRHPKAEQAEEGVTTFFIRTEGEEVRVDICRHHAGPIRAAYDAGVRITPKAGDLPANTRAAIERRFRQG